MPAIFETMRKAPYSWVPCLTYWNVYRNFKRLASIRARDDIKAVRGNLGHAIAARIEDFVKRVFGQQGKK